MVAAIAASMAPVAALTASTVTPDSLKETTAGVRISTVGDVEGDVDGDAEGLTLGDSEGLVLGDMDGLALGDTDGLMLGEFDGEALGLALGLALGETLGLRDGDPLGDVLGDRDGDTEGLVVGLFECGAARRSSVVAPVTCPKALLSLRMPSTKALPAPKWRTPGPPRRWSTNHRTAISGWQDTTLP